MVLVVVAAAAVLTLGSYFTTRFVIFFVVSSFCYALGVVFWATALMTFGVCGMLV